MEKDWNAAENDRLNLKNRPQITAKMSAINQMLFRPVSHGNNEHELLSRDFIDADRSYGGRTHSARCSLPPQCSLLSVRQRVGGIIRRITI
jgi:hypothetical protein